jgi:hypothetical protein
MHPSKFVLIDYENLHPRNLELLKQHNCKIKLFLSSSQARMPLETVKSLQVFGEDVEYIQITGTGPNALDFHIAYYLGRIALQHPDAEFYVLSKDTGFDPLMLHIRHSNVSCNRVTSVEQIIGVKTPKTKTAVKKAVAEVATTDASSTQARIDKVCANLTKRPNARPRTLKSLRSTVHALFLKKLPAPELDALMQELERKGVIAVTDGKLSYGTALKAEK